MTVRINSDFSLEMDPGHKAFQDTFDEGFGNSPSVRDILFKVEMSDKPDETIVALSDVGEPELRTPGSAPTAQRDVNEQWKYTMTHAEYAMFTKVDEGTWEDMKLERRASYPMKYGMAMNSKAEALAASVVSGGFATAGPDGEFVFDTDHPLGNAVGTWSNKGTTALSAASLAAVRAAMRNQLSPSGRVQQTPFGRYLVTPPALEGTAYEVTNARVIGKPALVTGGSTGAGDVGSEWNDANFAQSIGVLPVTWDYLTGSADDWFVFIAPGDMMEGFQFYWRVAPSYRGGMDEESTRYWMNARMRLSTAAIDARQAYGNDV